MEWEALVCQTAAGAGVSPEEARTVLNALFDTLGEAMQRERLILLRPDLGHFEMQERPSAAGTVRRVPVFRESGTLRARLREQDEPEKAD